MNRIHNIDRLAIEEKNFQVNHFICPVFSMMDHYYDKLLQIAVFDSRVVKNPYLTQEAAKGTEKYVFVLINTLLVSYIPVTMNIHVYTYSNTVSVPSLEL